MLGEGGRQLLLMEDTVGTCLMRERIGAFQGWLSLGGLGRGRLGRGRLSAQPSTARIWKGGRLCLFSTPFCGPALIAGKGSSQLMMANAPVVMPCSPFSLQPRRLSSPCSWPASTAAAIPGSTCSSRATSSTSSCSASSAAPPAT